jgi:hypothetical protein
MDEIKKLIAFLVALSATLGSVITFLLALPFENENIPIVVGALAVAIGVIGALIKFLKDIDKVAKPIPA